MKQRWLASATLPLVALACAQNTVPPNSPLTDAITATEITERGETLAIPREGVTEVDVNSTVILKVNAGAIKQAASAANQIDPEEVEQLAAQVTEVEALLSKQKQAVETLSGWALRTDVPEKELKKQGQLERDVAEGVIKLAEKRGDDPDALYAQPGYAGTLSYLGMVLKATRDKHQALMKKLDVVRWRMSASLRSTARSEPVHLPNYDTLEAGEVDVRNKLLPVVDQRVLDEMEQAQKLAKTARNLDGFTDLLKDNLQRRLDNAATEIETLLIELKARITSLDSFKSADARAKDLLTKTRNTIEAARSSEAPCKGALEALGVAVAGKDASSIARVVTALKPCVEALSKVREGAEATRKAAVQFATDPNLQALAGDVSREIKATLDSVAKIELLGTIVGRAQPSLAAPAWAPAAALTDRRLADLVDTRLDLTTTPRQLGDSVSYRGSVSDEERDVDIIEGPLRSLTVVQNGASVRVSGSLVFVQPFDLAENEDKFRAAPALTASFYYRCARNSGEVAPSGACAFWNVLSPGMGAQVATVVMGDLEQDPATGEEVAVSNVTPHVTPAVVGQLIGDLVQGGVGYDFQSARAYWFFGIGIQTMTDLGFDFEL